MHAHCMLDLCVYTTQDLFTGAVRQLSVCGWSLQVRLETPLHCLPLYSFSFSPPVSFFPPCLFFLTSFPPLCSSSLSPLFPFLPLFVRFSRPPLLPVDRLPICSNTALHCVVADAAGQTAVEPLYTEVYVPNRGVQQHVCPLV